MTNIFGSWIDDFVFLELILNSAISFFTDFLQYNCDAYFQVVNKLDLSYLRSVLQPDPQSLCITLKFNLMRSDRQSREYIFDSEENLNMFLKTMQPIAVKNFQRQIAEMKHCEVSVSGD